MGFKVLLVDDDRMVLFLHKILVENSQLPSDPLVFNSGKEVLEYLKKNAGSNDYYMLLLDLNMPEMDGWDVLNHIQDSGISEKVSVCIVTSSINIQDKEKAEAYKEVVSFVEKPLKLNLCNELGKTIRERIKNKN